MNENELAKIAVDIAYTVHNILGPGLLESVYESAFAYELDVRGIFYSRQKEMLIPYKSSKLDKAFRSDIIMEEKVLIELKSVECIERMHHKITLNYLRLTGIKLGFLINFNVVLIKDGIYRKVNGL
jgi:GxxExxY protein